MSHPHRRTFTLSRSPGARDGCRWLRVDSRGALQPLCRYQHRQDGGRLLRFNARPPTNRANGSNSKDTLYDLWTICLMDHAEPSRGYCCTKARSPRRTHAVNGKKNYSARPASKLYTIQEPGQRKGHKGGRRNRKPRQEKKQTSNRKRDPLTQSRHPPREPPGQPLRPVPSRSPGQTRQMPGGRGGSPQRHLARRPAS